MASINQVARSIRDLAQLNLRRGSTKAYKTGNLYRAIGSFNTVSRMVKERRGKSTVEVSIDIDYAPPTAPYGQFVNDGTRKMKARPFATNALNDPSINRIIDSYINTKIDEQVELLSKQVDRVFDEG